jgi:uncharacterized lipoprotein NlpE involved in copper resistance
LRSHAVRAALVLAAALMAPGTSTAGTTDATTAGKTVAGRYFGTLPSATCSSLDVLLTLDADGRYVLQSYCQDDLTASTTRSSWTVTWNGTCVDLASGADPAERRREFAIHDDNLLVLTAGSCIEPVEDPRGRTLRRAAGQDGHD